KWTLHGSRNACRRTLSQVLVFMAKQDTSKASGAGGISHHILSVERAETMSGRSGTGGNRAWRGKRGGSTSKPLGKGQPGRSQDSTAVRGLLADGTALHIQ